MHQILHFVIDFLKDDGAVHADKTELASGVQAFPRINHHADVRRCIAVIEHREAAGNRHRDTPPVFEFFFVAGDKI